jgi:hypothetical protein
MFNIFSLPFSGSSTIITISSQLNLQPKAPKPHFVYLHTKLSKYLSYGCSGAVVRITISGQSAQRSWDNGEKREDEMGNRQSNPANLYQHERISKPHSTAGRFSVPASSAAGSLFVNHINFFMW